MYTYQHMQQRILIGTVTLGALLLMGKNYINNEHRPHVNKPPVVATSTQGEPTGGTGSDGVPTSDKPERLSLRGSQIIDHNGNEIMLRGFNWGSWGTAQAQDAKDHVAQGANVVRMPLRWWGDYARTDVDSRDDAAPGHINPANLKKLDEYVSWASKEQLWIDLFIDSDCGQNGTQEGGLEAAYCDPTHIYGTKGHNFWTDPAMRKEFIEVWKFVANRYKNTPYIGMYEILPEPGAPGATQAQVTEFYKELIAAIRSVDPTTPILIGAGNGYNIKRAADAYIPNTTGIIYTGNLFIYTAKTKDANIAELAVRLQGLTALRDTHNVPIFVQQTGARSGDDPDLAYTHALLSLLNKNNVGWTWWTYRQDGPYPDGYGILYPNKTSAWITKNNVLSVITKYLQE